MASPAANMRTILIVDDEPAACQALRRGLEQRYHIARAESAATARDAIGRERPDVVLLDMAMPGEDAFPLLGWIAEQEHAPPVLVILTRDAAWTGVEALKEGAADYLVEGFDIEELRKRVSNLVRLVELEEENEGLKQRLVTEGQFGPMLGASRAMRRVFEVAENVAPTATTVLILGESGTGKDLLAQEIHRRSPRASRPFVAVNCAALPESLVESELFGYENDLFAGATQQKKGKFELAIGGTLFLDEVGDMNPVTQAKVLRVLEDRSGERLDATEPTAVDVRVISATHRYLPAEIAAGRFREDLYYRLRVVTIELPPLRAHKDDIALLAEAFLRLHAAHYGRTARLGRQAVEALVCYDWPGNIRELKNALERSLILARGEEMGLDDLPEEIRSGQPVAIQPDSAADMLPLAEPDFREAKRKFEIAYLTGKLEEHHWNVSHTAAAVGVHRQSLQERMRGLGIQRPGRK